jgi:16S rRNA (adenine1518-N6/adenine1519-N6)-dimethyltransferase
MYYKKKYGQNFISDTNFLKSLVAAAGITADDEALEIGAGAGGLTAALAEAAKKVVSYEIDLSLKPVLDGLFFPNLTVIYKDIMKESFASIKANFSKNYKLCANLPYYITTPILFKFLDADSGVSEMAVMVQKEVAARITANAGSKSYGALTVAVNAVADTSVLKQVNRKMFFPVPNVDSTFIGIKMNAQKAEKIKDKPSLDKLIRAAFSSRRKTLVNNLMSGFGMPREKAEEFLVKYGIDIRARGETLTVEQFVGLANGIAAYI